MDREPLDRIDSFPYRHRVRDIMVAPPVTVPSGTPARDAVTLMIEKGISSVFVSKGETTVGIVTERDILRQCLRGTGKDITTRVDDIMSAPVISVRDDAFVFVALGRMARRNVRHLLVVDHAGHGVGILTSRGLLKVRAGDTLRLGDELTDATDARDLAHVRVQLPRLARKMLDEGIDALGVSAVISAVYCDMTRRAWDIACRDMEAAGRGGVPAPVSVLVLGSSGRGESMLKPDQDNAIVHLGTDADDPWFADAAARMNVILNEAGVPFCNGDVMARNPYWRRTLTGWGEIIGDWVRTKDPHALMMSDIFFDLVSVAENGELAERLRRTALQGVRRSTIFLNFLAQQAGSYSPPIGLFGRIKTKGGRVDLKLGGLLPIVGGVRTMALQHEIPATSTTARLDGLVERGVIGGDDAAQMHQAHMTLQSAILNQQITDLEVGITPSSRVDLSRLSPRARARLKDALRGIEGIRLMVSDSLEVTFRENLGSADPTGPNPAE